jgi:hypothetical protein
MPKKPPIMNHANIRQKLAFTSTHSPPLRPQSINAEQTTDGAGKSKGFTILSLDTTSQMMIKQMTKNALIEKFLNCNHFRLSDFTLSNY